MALKRLLKNRAALFLLVWVGLTFLLCGYWLYNQVKRHESNEIAEVTWKETGNPYVVVVHVRDAVGNPVRGASVSVENDSGGNSATTNNVGIAKTERLGEPEFSGLEINKRRVVDRPHAGLLYSPSVSNGLRVDVHLK